jgi:hypothetical protein
VADLLDISETVFGNEIGAAEKRIAAGEDAFHQVRWLFPGESSDTDDGEW